MYVDTTNVVERLVGCRGLADRMHELASALPGRVAKQLAITDGRAVASGECRLVVRELVSSGDVEAEQASFYTESLDPEQEDAAAAIIHTVFDCLDAQESASLAQATSGAFFSN